MNPLSSSSSSDPSCFPSTPSQSDREIRVVTIPRGSTPFNKAIYGIGQPLSESLIGQSVVRTAPVRNGSEYDWSYCPGGYTSNCETDKLISINDIFFKFEDRCGYTIKIEKNSNFNDDNWMTLERYNEFISSPSFSSHPVERQSLTPDESIGERIIRSARDHVSDGLSRTETHRLTYGLGDSLELLRSSIGTPMALPSSDSHSGHETQRPASSESSCFPSTPSQSDRQIRVVALPYPGLPDNKAIYGIGQRLTESMIGQWVVRTAPIRYRRGYDWSSCPFGLKDFVDLKQHKLISICDSTFVLENYITHMTHHYEKSQFDDDNWVTVERYNEFISSPSFSSHPVERQSLTPIDSMAERISLLHDLFSGDSMSGRLSRTETPSLTNGLDDFMEFLSSRVGTPMALPSSEYDVLRERIPPFRPSHFMGNRSSRHETQRPASSSASSSEPKPPKDTREMIRISSGTIKVKCPMALVENEPETLLNLIGQQIKLNHSLPKKLEMDILGNQTKTVDAGAPRRVFVSTLFHSLKKGKAPNIKFSKSENGLLLPKVSHHIKINKDEKKAFIKLGVMIAFLLNSEEHYPIGQFFDPQFFNFLFDPLIDEPIPKGSHKTIFEQLGRKLGSEKRVREIKAILDAKIIPSSSATSSHETDHCLSSEIIETYQTYGYEMTQMSLEKDKKAILKEFIKEILNIRKAIRLIAKGISQVYPRSELLKLGVPATVEKLHGYLSPELFKNIVIFDHPLDGNDEKLLAKSIAMNDWFNEWREGLDLAKMRKFLNRTTGSTEYTRMVTFQVTRSVKSPVEHACFGKIDFPYKKCTQDYCIAYFEDLASGAFTTGFNEI